MIGHHVGQRPCAVAVQSVPLAACAPPPTEVNEVIRDLPVLGVLALILNGLFALLIVGGLVLARRQQTRDLRQLDAAFARTRFEHGPTPAQTMLYRVWQTGMREVALIVRDQHGENAGTIRRGAGDTTITAGNTSYRVAVIPGTDARAELLASGNGTTAAMIPACRFASSDWFGHQVGRHELSVCRDGRVVGELTALGSLVARGLAIALTSSIPLPVSLFMLCKGAGTRTHASGQ